MTVARTALVTGANQGLGRALAEGLAARMDPQDRVLVTGRDAGRVEAAARDIAAGPAVACVEARVLDVRDGDAIGAPLRAGQQPGRHLGPAPRDRQIALVEDRHPRRVQHRPRRLAGDQLVRGQRTRHDHVAGAQELRRGRAGHDDLAGHHPVDDQETPARRTQRGRVPAPGRDALHSQLAGAGRGSPLARRDVGQQVRIELEQPSRRHTLAFLPTPTGSAITPARSAF